MHRCYYIGLPISFFIISMISEDMAVEFKGILRKFKKFKRAIVVMCCMFNFQLMLKFHYIKGSNVFISPPRRKTLVKDMSPPLGS